MKTSRFSSPTIKSIETFPYHNSLFQSPLVAFNTVSFLSLAYFIYNWLHTGTQMTSLMTLMPLNAPLKSTVRWCFIDSRSCSNWINNKEEKLFWNVRKLFDDTTGFFHSINRYKVIQKAVVVMCWRRYR